MFGLPVMLNFWSDFWIALRQQIKAGWQHGDIGDEIEKAIAPRILFSFKLAGNSFLFSDAVLVSWLVLPFLLLLAWWLGRKRDLLPVSPRQLVSESLVSILLDLCQNSGMSLVQAEKVVPFAGSIGIFIAATNLAALFGLAPPAKNPAFPLALALLTIVYVIYMSISFVGLKGFGAALIYPRALLLPFKILDFLIKPISLSLRLFGNVFGAYILMEFVSLIIPVLVPGLLGLWFDLADGILQAVIFTYLTASYIGEIVENAHAAQAEKQTQLAVDSQ